jgi:uncharacterized membrane protein YdfJ with MMPL/SSD domain
MAFALLYWSAPPWHEVAQDREFGFLPEDAPSYQGQVLFNRAFPHQKQVSNIVIVLSREHEDLRPEDRAFVRSTVTPALARAAKENGGLLDEKSVSANDRSNTKSIVAAIHTPDDPGSGALLISANRRAMLVMLELSTELLEQRNWPLIEKTESLISQ